MIIIDANDQSERPDTDSKVQVVYPKLKSFGAFGVGCMHSKLQLLFYADYLRVVVPTVSSPYERDLIQGNLVAYDWGETGIMENVSPCISSQLTVDDVYPRFPSTSVSATTGLHAPVCQGPTIFHQNTNSPNSYPQ